MMYHWSALENKAKTMPNGAAYLDLCRKLGTMHGNHIEIPGDGVAEIQRQFPPTPRPAIAAKTRKPCNNCRGL